MLLTHVQSRTTIIEFWNIPPPKELQDYYSRASAPSPSA